MRTNRIDFGFEKQDTGLGGEEIPFCYQKGAGFFSNYLFQHFQGQCCAGCLFLFFPGFWCFSDVVQDPLEKMV